MNIVLDTELRLPIFGKGKVRDTYITGNNLLMIATDRISAFDVVLPTGIPDKGTILNQLSVFWFGKTYHIVHNHLVESVESRRALAKYTIGKRPLPEWLMGRSMVVLKAERIPVECVVRGYISGSAWAEYRKSGTINGLKARSGLKESQQLPEPLFTPTTKADTGHDIPLKPKQLINLVGEKTARQLEDKSLALYRFARDYAIERGIIIADTKFEFGMLEGKVILIDEIFSSDSSRFWDMQVYQKGRPQESFDKQYVRDYLESIHWNKQPPAPALPEEVVLKTLEKYQQAYQRLIK